MPWFESSKQKEFRQLVQSKMKICLTKPQQYEQAFQVLDSLVRKPNQKAIQMIVDHIKQVIKEDDYQPQQKLRAMILLRDLMESQSKSLGKYVVKKILKRLTIFAEHRKSQKDQNRGANIFKCKKSEQKYGIEFLKTLLLALEEWGKNWPRHADGPFHDFQSAYNDLLMQKQVTFPRQQRRTKSPVPTMLRKNQPITSPPKIPTIQRKSIQNPISKPIIKQRQPLSGQSLQYINGLIQISNLLVVALTQNPQFGEMWSIIKAYIQQYKQLDEKGNLLVAQMIQKGQQNKNPQFLQTIQSNSDFIRQLIDDVGKVDRKNQIYGKFNTKYIKRCKKLIVSLSIFTDKSINISNNNSNNNSANLSTSLKTPGNQSSINNNISKIQQKKPKILQQRNRYGSSNQLRNQLQINLQSINKQDFNSGRHKFGENSQGSSRYNSVSGNKQKQKQRQVDNNRQSTSQFNVSKEISQQNTDNNRKSTNLDDFKKPPMSKITEKQQQFNNSTHKFDFENDIPKQSKNNVNASFGDFQISGDKNKQDKQSDSNSNFFKQLEQKNQKQLQGLRGRKQPNKKRSNGEDNKDFFNDSIKSKNQGDGFSGFSKSKNQSNSKSKIQSKESKQLQGQKSQQDIAKPFDTFKNTNQIAKAMQQLKKSSKFSDKSSVSNPFQKDDKHSANNENPFETNMNNSFNKSQGMASNPFTVQRKGTKDLDNPFDQKNEDNDNPFASKIGSAGIGVFSNKDKNQDDQNKSKSSNPFSSKTDQNKSMQKSSVKSKPPLPRRQSTTSNPFQTKTPNQPRSQNPFERQQSYNASKISNPFQSKANNNSSQKSLSQRGSFVDPRNSQKIQPKNASKMEDPFEFNKSQQKEKKEKANDSLQFSTKKSGQAKEKSFQGFDFDDFMNVNGRRSQTTSVKQIPTQQQAQVAQTKKQQEPSRQSGFNFSDFGNANDNKSENSDFFAQKQSKISQQSQKNNKKQTKIQTQKQKNNAQHQQSMDWFKSNNFTNQQQIPMKDNFFQNSQSKQSDKNKSQQLRKSFDGMQFGFDDFPNVNSSSQKNTDSMKNPFSQFQSSKNTVQLKKKQEQLRKHSANISEDEWNKFGNVEKISDDDLLRKKQEQSRYEQSQAGKQQQDQHRHRTDTPWFQNNQFKRQGSQQRDRNLYIENQSKFVQKQPHFGQQKSISLQFQQPSPFQKKQIPWDFTLAALPSSARYNVTPQDILKKKQQLQTLQSINSDKLNKYKQLNEKLDQFKKVYASHLQNISESRQQKRQFTQISKRLQQTNSAKQKQIQDLIKKMKKAQQIKRKILQNERILYQRMRNQRQSRNIDLMTRQKIGNKYERFNNNLKKQRETFTQMQRSITNFSYYA